MKHLQIFIDFSIYSFKNLSSSFQLGEFSIVLSGVQLLYRYRIWYEFKFDRKGNKGSTRSEVIEITYKT